MMETGLLFLLVSKEYNFSSQTSCGCQIANLALSAFRPQLCRLPLDCGLVCGLVNYLKSVYNGF